MMKSENIAGISFFLRILCVNTVVLNFTMLSKLRISSKYKYGVECSLLSAKNILHMLLFCFVRSLFNLV